MRRSVNQIKKARKEARNKIRTLRNRTSRFFRSAQDCSGNNYTAKIKRSKRLYAKSLKLLREHFAQKILVCSAGICTKTSMAGVKSSLRRLAVRLAKQSLKAKVKAIYDCNIKDNGGGSGKVSKNYRNQALKAIKRLPAEKSSC